MSLNRAVVFDSGFKDPIALLSGLAALQRAGYQVEIAAPSWTKPFFDKQETDIRSPVPLNEGHELGKLIQDIERGSLGGMRVIVLGKQDPTKTGYENIQLFRRLLPMTLESEVYVVQDPADLARLPSPTQPQSAEARAELRRQLAAKALSAISEFDSAAAAAMRRGDFPAEDKRRVLVLGGGGREHAIALALARSDAVKVVFVSAGNSGTALLGSASADPGLCAVLNVAAIAPAQLAAFAEEQGVGLVIVGPEQALADGIADILKEKGISCFGPSRAASRIESSKAWAKEFMRRHGIPTAAFEVFRDFPAAEAHLRSAAHRFVIKASGLAEGKGVFLPESAEEAVQAARSLLEEGALGEAGREVVVEERLLGEEVSVLAFSDGQTVVGMPAAQDHKRLLEGDEGPNTGGMGAYAPAPIITPKQHAECLGLLQKVVTEMAAEGAPFVGVLYGGFMLTAQGPAVLEFNCRFGDPETQALLPLLESDLYHVCASCAAGTLCAEDVRWKQQVACAVVCAAAGYPGPNYTRGARIRGLDQIPQLHLGDALQVYYSGAALADERDPAAGVVTTGGRVLTVTGIATTLREAQCIAYEGVQAISFEGMHFRKDIGDRGLQRPLRVGVLSSARGTALQAVIDAIEAGSLNASIVLIVSNHADAPVLERARRHNLPYQVVDAARKSREAYDAEVMAALDAEGVDVVLMVGYFRIASPAFVEHYRYRCLNVHPSLLPEFSGGMDLEVHSAVLAARRLETGCTIHFVFEQVDAGPIVLQKRCTVNYPSETPESLKAKVQALEGDALVEALQMYLDGSIERVTSVVTADRVRAVSISAPDVLKVTHSGGEVTYKQAGVDIAAGDAFVRAIKPFCKDTWRKGCVAGQLGGFGSLFDLGNSGHIARDTVLVAGTDGVGTKLLVAQAVGRHESIGVDLVAMCANDVLVCGAEPLFFLDYFATGALDVEQAAQVVQGIARGCKFAGAALVGGETAEMAGMYRPGEYDIAGFCVGAVHGSEVLPRLLAIQDGDVLIALRSTGAHSNGFSLVRKCAEMAGLRWDDPPPFDSPYATLADALLVPTRIYVKELLPVLRRRLVKSMAHITGGGLLGNIPRALPNHLRAVLNASAAHWSLPPVFRWVQETARLSQQELLRTFNCGIGMVLVVDRAAVPEVMTQLEVSPSAPFILGSVRPRPPFYDMPVPAGDMQGEAAQVTIVGNLA